MQYLTDYQAILFDVDRTLIPPTREIFPEVVTMLKQLQQAGIHTGLCSGRGYAILAHPLMPLFPNNAVHIFSGGAFVMTSSGETLWQQTIDPEVIIELLDLTNKTNSEAIFTKPHTLFSQGKTLLQIQSHPWQPTYQELSALTPQGVGLVYIGNPNEEIHIYLRNHPKLSSKFMTDNHGQPYYDITAKGVTKALALDQWSKITGIPLSKTIGFGDSSNDLEFLQQCGFAVAMGNADSEIKTIADRIIGDVQDKGLPKYVADILEGKQL